MNVREHPSVRVSQEKARGCGYRRPGGIYLVSDGLAQPCGRLPILVEKCPCCGQGIKPARGWTWVDVELLLKDAPACGDRHCAGSDNRALMFVDAIRDCPLNGKIKRAGLIWVGSRFYATPANFNAEAAEMGVSRRLSALPKDFKLGETWVLLAHREFPIEGSPFVAFDLEKKTVQAIFHAFKPSRIEKILKGDESKEEIDALVKRGISPVVVEKIGEQQPILDHHGLPAPLAGEKEFDEDPGRDES